MRRALMSSLLAVCALSAQTRHSAQERHQLFEQYLMRRAASVTRTNLAGIDSLEAWKQRRPVERKRLLSMLGLNPMPARTPLRARITKTFARDGYRVENIVFESIPRLYVTGNLYLPAEAGRHPAIVYVSGHAPGPWGAKVQYQHHGIWLARHGYAAFVLDTVEFGEVPGIHHGLHDLEMWDWLSLGYTPAGPEVWNAMRALDYLETRPEVDASKAGITGISGGGAITWYTAAVDERFDAAASVCATWTVEAHAALDAVHENCDCIYFVNPWRADLPAVGALIAPRPFQMLSASRDPSFPAAGYKDAYRRTRAIYDLYGAGDKVAEYEHAAPHSDIVPFRKEANEWLNRWLRQDATPFDEGVIQREEAATLTVLDQIPEDAVNGHIHRLWVPAHTPRPHATLAAWKQRRTQLLGQLREQPFRSFPEQKVAFDPYKSPEKGWSSRYSDAWNLELTTEEGVRVKAMLWVPRDRSRRSEALVYVKGEKDVVYPVDYDLLLPALGRMVVLQLEPRMVDYPISNYRVATLKRTAALAGSTIESQQVWDMLRAIDYLFEGEGLSPQRIHLLGRRDMGVLAMYAAALDDRVTRVIVEDPPATHWYGPALLNVLRLTDIPEAAALLAPRELVFLSPRNAAFTYTQSVYALYGTRKAVREVNGLAEALFPPPKPGR